MGVADGDNREEWEKLRTIYRLFLICIYQNSVIFLREIICDSRTTAKLRNQFFA